MECNLLSPLPCACVCARMCTCACVCNYLVLWHTAQFPGDGHCSLIKVGFFHRQSEVCEGASERPDERADSSGEKLLLFLFSFFCNTVQDPHLPPHTSSTPLLFSLAAPTHPAGTLSAIIHSAYSSVSSVFPHFLTKNVFFSLSFNFATNSSNRLPSLARLLQHTPQTVCVGDYFPL